MCRAKSVVMGVGVAVTVGLMGLVGAVVVRSDRTFDAPYPAIRASADPAVIARGRYLANGPAHCVSCHGESAARGEGASPRHDEPMSGGAPFHLPVGTIYAPNITPDPDTGVGRLRDEELARALRHGVGSDGRALVPFMAFAHLSDEDLTAVLSYLRSRPAVRHEVPRAEWNALGLAVRAFVLEPKGPERDVPSSVPAEPTEAYGRYLVEDVANCSGCHTERDLRTGEAVGPVLGGGLELPSHDVPGLVFETPNLTPDPDTGRIARWSEEVFVARFRSPGATGTPMPWANFAGMTDDDLRAIYRYLRTLPPAHHETRSSGAPVAWGPTRERASAHDDRRGAEVTR